MLSLAFWECSLRFFSLRFSLPRSRAFMALAVATAVEEPATVLEPERCLSLAPDAALSFSMESNSSVKARDIRSRWRSFHSRMGSRTAK